MSGYEIVSFLTDYGLSDGFVATCHGVLLGIAPSVRVIDISHVVPPQDIRTGARLLARVTPYLPRAIHVAVVDPGVGGKRRSIAVKTDRGVFVGPDNGLLSWAVEQAGGAIAAYELTNEKFFRHPVSRTFHGRDIYIPVAGHLVRGTALAEVGPEIPAASLTALPTPLETIEDDGLRAEIILTDHFGNLHLASRRERLEAFSLSIGQPVVVVTAAGEHRATYVEVFEEVPVGELAFYEDAVGQLTIAVSSGNAAQRLGVATGDVLRIRVVL
ncbi:(R)-S-adenosyl-L-methionine hydrolase [Frankia sp. AiPs1]|uniref:SAM hydrolase/SAM-dependent halogenase family protein n=1 Tax=Frankia sp. AiPa1 TaxID=573492 RepID=UPI00202B5D8A|nr:SAM-dependent chlorinase/fluorinase [Frankia sp. AiPa1]MCL9762739.1 SAM-dependent chlorinase/fluorinase [Frankia sp. AiPa1]